MMGGSTNPSIMVADDEPETFEVLQFYLARWGFRVAYAANKVTLLEKIARESPDVVLLDLQFGEVDGIELLPDLLRFDPELTIVLLTGHGSIDSAVTAVKLGAYDYLTKPPDVARMKVTLDHAIAERGLKQRIKHLESSSPHPAEQILGDSPAIRQCRELIATVAATDANVLLLGESGTGKDLAARAIHALSNRAQGPLVPVNMAALPADLVESMLFGHEKGAFTGADRIHRGCCESANGGTLFLDEIGDMSLVLQAKLLRFLQDRSFQRVGASAAQSSDVRVIAATNRDLSDAVRHGRFREDLYYRLHVVPVELPSLRQRIQDIPLLANCFLLRASQRHGKKFDGFTPAALVRLAEYHWPGNVRQLENVVERLVILHRTRIIGVEALPPEIHRTASKAAISCFAGIDATPDCRPTRRIDELEKEALTRALQSTRGDVRAAAEVLGVSRATAYRMVKRHRMLA